MTPRTPVGILRLEVGGFDLRPQAVVVVAAIAARLFASGSRVPRFDGLQLLWGCFLLWYATSMITGYTNGIPLAGVFFQGKAVLFIVGGILIASGANLVRVARSFTKYAMPAAAVVVIAFVVRIAGLDLGVNTPLQDLPQLGKLANDTVTLFTVYGLGVILMELSQRRRSVRNLGAGAIMMLAPLASDQRASFLALGVTVVVCGLAAFGPTWKRRMHLTVTQLVLGLSVAVAVFLGGYIASSSPGIVGAQLSDTFAGEQEANTAKIRVELAKLAWDTIEESPVIGAGMGATIRYRTEFAPEAEDFGSHNVVLDVAMRSGAIGAGLFLMALLSTLVVIGRLWRKLPDDRLAVLALISGLAFIAVMSKAMVEPAIELHRLACLMGMAIGLLVNLGRDGMDLRIEDETDPDEASNPDQPAGDPVHPLLAKASF